METGFVASSRSASPAMLWSAKRMKLLSRPSRRNRNRRIPASSASLRHCLRKRRKKRRRECNLESDVVVNQLDYSLMNMWWHSVVGIELKTYCDFDVS